MKRTLTTTALVMLMMGATANAQSDQPAEPGDTEPAATMVTTTHIQIIAPEGFAAEDVVFTSDNLDGATVYDATGEEIGEVHGLVFANEDSSMKMSSDMGKPAGETAADAGMGSDMDSAAAPDMAEQTPATGATSQDGTMSGIGSSSSTTTPTDAMTPPVQTAEGTPTDLGEAEITQAVIDVGGFLGMGEHRVAVPVEELVTYRKDQELRIYLPWTREQVMELPEFDAEEPT
ncbi:photosystem reaction center protein H [Paracoccus sp. MBLB3053]|uniref:Photosystem reaction center protein H n=1 Tax=Paracoccus aurantius TaxID=3073814 RepID=A0ABU2HWC7_9RHOB|nr:photosystem reaction center protein H [Paracoccus sp. MBLB3053]MDS9468860.1 photosystem reaction center protein H [Paracoccus sp. MBLB3053]